jgi:hypothetical protein
MAANMGLSAPEAFVLLSLPKFDIPKTLKLGFMGLLAEGMLKIDEEQRPGVLRVRRIVHLRVATRAPDALSPLAASLVRIVRAAEPSGLMKDVVKQARREYGAAYIRLVQEYVYPALAGRGLAESRKSRLLGLVPVTRYFRTPAGEVEKIRVESAMRDARSIPQYLDRDPAQAAALVATAGAAILLVEELRPHYQALAAALRRRDSNLYFSSDGFGDGGGGGFDFGSIDFSSFDVGAFDSFDAGFSDAGGDSGGDGGGGDGGSSGC